MIKSDEMQNQICSFLRLFKKLPSDIYTKNQNFDIFEDYGTFTLQLKEEYLGVVQQAIKTVLPEASRFNDTFWKSFNSVANKSQEDLWTHAIIHYFTTYGLEALNIDNKGFVYLPEQIIKNAPELEKFFYIDSLSKEEAINQILLILNSNTGITINTIEDCFNVLSYFNKTLSLEEINSLSNREVKAFLYTKLKLFPDSAKEIMNVLNYCLTNNTLFIKSQDNLKLWQYQSSYQRPNSFYISALIKHEAEEGTSLAKSWFRYKDFLLQLKRYDKQTSSYINQISRRAKKEYLPLNDKEFFTTEVLNADGDELPFIQIDYLKNLDIYQLIKIYNKINLYFTRTANYDFYTIRNGKFYIKQSNHKIIYSKFLNKVLGTIKEIIKKRYSNVAVIYPENLDLAFPTSEKRFIGDVPFNSIATFQEASVIGISWKNQGNKRVDIDLSMITEQGTKYGWNGLYKDKDMSFIYSGDMTTEGAESFFIQKPETKALLYMNLFNVNSSEFDFFISNEQKNVWEENKTTLNPNNIIFSTKLSANRESLLGLYSQNQFIFTNLLGSKSNVSRPSKILLENLEVIEESAKSSLKLNDIFDDYDTAFEKFVKNYDSIEEAKQKFEDSYTLIDLSTPSKSEILNLINCCII